MRPSTCNNNTPLEKQHKQQLGPAASFLLRDPGARAAAGDSGSKHAAVSLARWVTAWERGPELKMSRKRVQLRRRANWEPVKDVNTQALIACPITAI